MGKMPFPGSNDHRAGLSENLVQDRGGNGLAARGRAFGRRTAQEGVNRGKGCRNSSGAAHQPDSANGDTDHGITEAETDHRSVDPAGGRITNGQPGLGGGQGRRYGNRRLVGDMKNSTG